VRSGTVVLDASALLALLNDEPGGEQVAAELPHVSISAVNLSEAVAKLAEHGMPEPAIHSALESLGLDVVDFGRVLAYMGGLLRPPTKALGLSLGDRACIALGLHLGRPVITADHLWSQLDVGVDIQVIR